MKHLLPFTLLLALLTTALSAEIRRAGTWQVALTPTYTTAKKLNYANGQYLALNARTGWGFGVGYNMSEHFSLDLNFNASNGSYNANVNDKNGTAHQFNTDLYSSSINLEFTYNIIDGPLTPYLTVNMGSTFVDSGIATGNLNVGCGYYYCSYYNETYTAARFDAGVGLGLRYDLKNGLFFKGGAHTTYIDYSTSSTPYFIDYQLSIGTSFR